MSVEREVRNGAGTPLAGRAALVTGAAGGIGPGIARALAAAGAAVMLSEPGRPGADLAGEAGVPVVHHPADIAVAGEVAALVRAAEARLGGIDILVHAAAHRHAAPLEEVSPAAWEAAIAAGLTGAFHAVRAVLPGMKARGWGRIVTIASAHGLVASPLEAAGVAAAHGLVGLTKVIALETAERGITANTICPGHVWTPALEAEVERLAAAQGLPRAQVVREVLLRRHPNRRLVRVEEIGGAVVFLCSEAASSITGTQLAVDGGWTAE